MPLPESKTIEIGQLVPVNSSGVSSVYANNVGISGTPWDIRFFFSEVILDGTAPRAELRANVVMSITHARALLDALTASLPAMEAQATATTKTSKAVKPAKAAKRLQ
jgi:hypothetical protein